MSLDRFHSAFGHVAATGVAALCLFLAFPAFVIAGESAAGPKSTPAAKQVSQAQVVAAYGKLPLNFEANQGQTDPRVKFLSRGRGYSLFLTSNEAVLALRSASPKSKGEGRRAETGSRQLSVVSGQWQRETDDGSRATGALLSPSIFNHQSSIANPESRIPNPKSRVPTVLRLKLHGANPSAKVSGLDELPGKSNYFLGNDPKKWRTNLPNYAKVKYEGVYPGIDLVYYGNQRQLECDFIVAPGADPQAIRFAVETGNARPENRNSKSENQQPFSPSPESRTPSPASVHVDANGDLVIATYGGDVRFRKPVVYQIKSAVGSQQSAVALNHQSAIHNRQFLDGRYVLLAENRVAFEVAAYDSNKPLIIDPVLSYSTYLGDSNVDEAAAIAVDGSGNAYLIGDTTSGEFPTLNPEQPANAGLSDVFVTKIDAAGSALLYSTYLGGSADDTAYQYGGGIAVDSAGNAYLTGGTSSTDFPTTVGAVGPFQRSLGGGTDAFVAKLGPTGSVLVYSTYLGGSAYDFGGGIALDSSGNAYVAGQTYSSDFPLSNPLQLSFGGSSDAFVASLNTTGSALNYSTYLGGSADDFAFGIAVDGSGNAYVTGRTYSSNFPMVNAYQAAFGGVADAFVAKLAPGGASFLYSTYLGGSDMDGAIGIAADSSGNAYVTGWTYSSNFPTVGALQGRGVAGSEDVFITKVNPTGSGLVYSTFAGGTGDDLGYGVAVDSSGNAYVTGNTSSTDFPTASPLQDTNAGAEDAFVTKVNSAGSAVIFSTYLGGSGTDKGTAIAVDATGDAYVAGATASMNFPTTTGAYDRSCGTDGACNQGANDAFVAKLTDLASPVVTLSPTSLDFGSLGVGFTSAPQTVTLTNNGDAVLNVTSMAVSGDCALAGSTTCPASGTVAAGTSCTIDVTFTPTAIGARAGTLTIEDNAAGWPHTVSLSGTGLAAPAVGFSVPSLSFGEQRVDLPSAPQVVTLNNTGSAALTITKIVTTGDFAQTSDCPLSPATLASGASCNISVTFTPGSPGFYAESLTVTDNAPGSPRVVTLAGRGTTLPARAFVAFTPKTDFASGLGALALAAGDFNGDGKPDLAVVASATTVSILLGNGDGTFGAHVEYPTSGDTKSVALGDFDGDGKLDLALAHWSMNTVGILLGKGDGTFQTEVAYATGAEPYWVTIGDFNQDGRLDLATANALGCTDSILLGNGDGTFQSHVDYAAGVYPYFVAVGDFNGDGKQDLATANYGAVGDVNVSILLGNGDGTFQAKIDYAAGAFPEGVAVGDFNGDGKADLAVANFWSNTVSMFFGNGDGTFQPKVDYAGKSAPRQVVSRDLNGDGRLDLIVVDGFSDFVSVLLGNGDGTFQPRLDYGTGRVPSGVISADFNGDGHPDLAVADSGSNAVSILLNMPLFISPTSLDFGSQVVGTSATQTVSLTNIGDTSLDISIGPPSGDFAVTPQTNPCGTSLAAGANCNLSITFTPTATGPRPGSVTVTFSGPASPQTINLSGAGIQPAVALSPASVGFTGNPLNLDCPSKTVTLTNTGDVSLTLVSITATPPFRVTYDTCPTEMGVGEGCTTIQVKFSPTVVGLATGTLTVTTDPPVTSGNTVSLSGNGLPTCQLLVKARSAKVLRGTEATDFDISDSRPSCSPTNLNLTCTADNPAMCALNPTVIPPSGTSRLTVTNLRAVTAEAVRVVVNSVSEFRTASEAVNVLISDFAFTRAPERASVRAGESTSYALVIRPVNGLEGSVQLSCSGAPQGAKCTVTPSSVTLDGSSLGQATVRVTTTARALTGPGRQGPPPLGPQPGLPLLGLVSLAGLAMLIARRRRVWLALSMSLLLVLVWAACGGGGFMLISSGSGTPAGTYMLTITGSYPASSGEAALTHGTTVTLTVN